MIDEMVKLEESLHKKVSTLVDAIDRADPLTSKYRELLLNFESTMSVLSTLHVCNTAEDTCEEVKLEGGD